MNTKVLNIKIIIKNIFDYIKFKERYYYGFITY